VDSSGKIEMGRLWRGFVVITRNIFCEEEVNERGAERQSGDCVPRRGLVLPSWVIEHLPSAVSVWFPSLLLEWCSGEFRVCSGTGAAAYG